LGFESIKDRCRAVCLEHPELALQPVEIKPVVEIGSAEQWKAFERRTGMATQP
jgi:hypothetical protein